MMSLEEKILLADQMIDENRDSTVKDFLYALKCGRRPIRVLLAEPEPKEEDESIFVDRRTVTFMYSYLGLLRDVQEKYKPTEDTIISRPPAAYSNKSHFGIATAQLKINQFDR